MFGWIRLTKWSNGPEGGIGSGESRLDGLVQSYSQPTWIDLVQEQTAQTQIHQIPSSPGRSSAGSQEELLRQQRRCAAAEAALKAERGVLEAWGLPRCATRAAGNVWAFGPPRVA